MSLVYRGIYGGRGEVLYGVIFAASTYSRIRQLCSDVPAYPINHPRDFQPLSLINYQVASTLRLELKY